MKRSAGHCLPRFTGVADSGEPLYQQLYRFLRTAITSGELAGGSRLPSTRGLAERWQLSRNTVLTAYELLAADGLITGRIGSGTRVRCGMVRRSALPKLPDLQAMLRAAHYPGVVTPIVDPDGNPLFVSRVSE